MRHWGKLGRETEGWDGEHREGETENRARGCRDHEKTSTELQRFDQYQLTSSSVFQKENHCSSTQVPDLEIACKILCVDVCMFPQRSPDFQISDLKKGWESLIPNPTPNPLLAKDETALSCFSIYSRMSCFV